MVIRLQLDALITCYRRNIYESGPFRNVWSYEMWTPGKENRYRRLFSKDDLRLYAGQRVQVVGISLLTGNVPNLYIEERRGDAEFIIRNGQQVSLLRPIRGRALNTTYSPWIGVSVNGRKIGLNIPTVAFGRIVENAGSTPDVRVTKCFEPNDGLAYLLYANFKLIETSFK